MFAERSAAAIDAVIAVAVAENVARTKYPLHEIAQRVVRGWIGSPGHRRNLQGDFRLTGTGAARGRNGVFYVTQLYALPRAR